MLALLQNSYVRIPCDDFFLFSVLSERRTTISFKAERQTDPIAFTSESNELLTALTSNYSPNEVRFRSLPLYKADRYPKKVNRRTGRTAEAANRMAVLTYIYLNLITWGFVSTFSHL